MERHSKQPKKRVGNINLCTMMMIIKAKVWIIKAKHCIFQMISLFLNINLTIKKNTWLQRSTDFSLHNSRSFAVATLFFRNPLVAQTEWVFVTYLLQSFYQIVNGGYRTILLKAMAQYNIKVSQWRKMIQNYIIKYSKENMN